MHTCTAAMQCGGPELQSYSGGAYIHDTTCMNAKSHSLKRTGLAPNVKYSKNFILQNTTHASVTLTGTSMMVMMRRT